MFDFIILNINSIAIVILIGVGLFYLLKKGKDRLVKNIVLNIVIEAENYFESNKGKMKKRHVIREVYRRFPILNILLSQRKLDDLIEKCVLELKKVLDQD